MTTPPGAHEDAVTEAVRAHLVDITSPVVAHGLRSGMIRRREGRILTGAASTVARATGVPQTLLRMLFALSALLGIGVPMYLLVTLMTPTERTVESALQEDRRGRTEPRSRLSVADLLLHLLIGLSAVGAVLWMLLLVRELLLPALSVAAVCLILVTLVCIAAERARNARLVFLISETARRAGIVSAEEVREAVERQRRLAPLAWAGADDWDRANRAGADAGRDDRSAAERRTLDGIGIDPAITGEPREEQPTRSAAPSGPPSSAQ